MAFKDHKQRIKRLSRDRDGDILGMPLYLFIIIIVTVISLGIVLAWLAMVDDPPMSIDVSASPVTVFIYKGGNGKYANDSFDITVTVKDNNGDEVSGVLITLDGMSIKTKNGERPIETTNSDGKVEFRELKILDQEKPEGSIMVTAKWKDNIKDDTTVEVNEDLNYVSVEVNEDLNYVSVPFSELSDGKLHKYSYTTASGKQVRYFLILGPDTDYHAAIDLCQKLHPGNTGWYQDGDYVVCETEQCEYPINAIGTGSPGCCMPIDLEFQEVSSQIRVEKQYLEEAAQYFQ